MLLCTRDSFIIPSRSAYFHKKRVLLLVNKNSYLFDFARKYFYSKNALSFLCCVGFLLSMLRDHVLTV